MIKSFLITSGWALLPMTVGTIVVYILLPEWRWDDELFHVLLEGGGALIGFGLAFIVTGMIKKERLGVNYIWLAACFISMGTLDMAHAITPPGETFVWLHSTATFFGGLFAVLIWLPLSASDRFFNKWFLSTLLISSLAFSALSIIRPEAALPMLTEEKLFTWSAKFFNIAGGIGFLGAWFYFAREYHLHHHRESYFFSNHFCLFGLAGLVFEASMLWDGNWWLWHMLRVFAYILLMLHFGGLYWKDIEELARLNRELETGIQKRTLDLTLTIAELKQTQTQLVQSGKLASLGQLATGIAHELRQPLTVIRLTSQDMLSMIEEEDLSLEEIPAPLEKVLENCDRMNGIIDHLRSFSRKGENKMMEKINLESVIERSFILLDAQFRSRGIEVTTYVDKNLPPIKGNANQLEQVLINLLSNARDALEKHENPTVEINIRKEKNQVILTLADNGSGVPNDIQSAIFDPFFTTKEIGKGTGLGLSISHGIITDHGGTIKVSDSEGGGAKFTIALPVAAEI